MLRNNQLRSSIRQDKIGDGEKMQPETSEFNLNADREGLVEKNREYE